MAGLYSNALDSLSRGTVQEAHSRPAREESVGEVETFYPVETTDENEGPKADIRDFITGGLHRQCAIDTDTLGMVSGLPERTPVTISRQTGRMVVDSVRWTGDANGDGTPSPLVTADETRIRRGEMTFEFTTDSEDRRVIRHGHQSTDGEGYDASYIVRGDGSIEGHAGTVGFCFHSDGSYYYSGLGSYIVGGTPGEGAPETAAGDQETTGIATDGSTTSLAQSTTAGVN